MQTFIDFSVIIPAFRRPAELRCAILSALEQREVVVEILVVDDSPERSAEAVVTSLQDSRIIYLVNPQPSGGFPSRVRNLAWPHARGNFVHFLDDDDIVPQGHYAAVKAVFSEQPNIGVVFCRIEPFGSCSSEQLEHEKGYFAEASRLATICQRLGPKTAFVACLMFRWAIVVCGAGILRRDCLARLGGFDPELRLREDVDFYARAMRRFGVCFLDQVGLMYRIGSPSLMHSPNMTELDVRQLREAQLRTNTKYQQDWGILEFYALKLFARTVLKIL
jgi:glycosyltransferase involved in cell wall biosynthesis